MFKNALERLNSKELVQKVQIEESIKVYRKLKFNSKILSVSCGDGIWDFLLVNKFDHLIKKLICTDIVKNPIELSIYNSMKKKVDLQFIKVKKDKKFLLDSNYFDLIYHHDVIEHTRKPYNLISENYRLLKKGGILFFSTPNLLRLSNILRLFLGKLKFPNKIGSNEVIGDYIHEKEYHMEDLKILLEEIGFTKIQIFTRLFGLMNLQLFFNFKENSLLKQMGHIIFIKVIK